MLNLYLSVLINRSRLPKYIPQYCMYCSGKYQSRCGYVRELIPHSIVLFEKLTVRERAK
jgi:hypothetical protein